MRKGKREQRDYFKKLEEGKAEDTEANKKEPKLLVGKLKDVSMIGCLPKGAVFELM